MPCRNCRARGDQCTPVRMQQRKRQPAKEDNNVAHANSHQNMRPPLEPGSSILHSRTPLGTNETFAAIDQTASALREFDNQNDRQSVARNVSGRRDNKYHELCSDCEFRLPRSFTASSRASQARRWTNVLNEGPETALGVCSKRAITWIIARLGDASFEAKVSQFRRDVAKCLEIDARLSAERQPDPPKDDALAYMAGRYPPLIRLFRI